MDCPARSADAMALRLLAVCNQSLVRGSGEAQILQAICDWAVHQGEARRDKSSRISAINESLGTFRAENKFAIAARRQQTPDSPLRVGGLA